MNVTDKLYTEWAWRTKTGVPDINNPEDKAILNKLISEITDNKVIQEEEEISDEEIVQLIASIRQDREAIDHIRKYIKNRPKQNILFQTVKDAEITDSTIEGGNAPQQIFNILSDNNDLEEFQTYIEKGSFTFGSLGSSGNFIEKISSKGISSQSIKSILAIGGFERGRGVGKGEVALALFLKDVKMMTGAKGDLNWNGKYLEVKGIAGRLGSRDQSISDTLPLVQKKNSIPELQNNIRPDQFIPYMAEQGDANEVHREAVEFANKVYPDGEASKYITKDIIDDAKQLRKAFQKIYFRNYINKEGVDHFIFIDNTNGGYYSISKEDTDSLIDNLPTITTPITLNDTSPNVFKNGIKA